MTDINYDTTYIVDSIHDIFIVYTIILTYNILN